MIKVQDFALQKGVTPSAIYKHIRNHKETLKEHISKQGKNGTWLDEYACDFISNLMVSSPIVLGESQQQQEIDQLKRKNEELTDKLIKAQEIMLSMKDEMVNLQIENSSLRLKIEHQEEKKSFLKRFFGK